MKKINEASVNLTISNLESSDMRTLSQILSMADDAENSIDGGVEPELDGALDMGSDLDQPFNGDDYGMFDYEESVPSENFELDGVFESLERIAQLANINEEFATDLDEDEDDGTLTEEEENSFYDRANVAIGTSGDDLEEGTMGKITSAATGAVQGASLGARVGGGWGAAAGGVIGGALGWNSADDADEQNQQTNEDFIVEPLSQNTQEPRAAEFSIQKSPSEDMRYAIDCFDEYNDQPKQTEFELDPMFSIFGESANDDSENNQVEDTEDDDQLDESALYNFELDEDTTNELSSPGIGDNRVFGPYKNKMDAIVDARRECPHGAEGIDFEFQIKPDGVYWKKISTVNEDCDNSRVEPQNFDQSSFKGDKTSNHNKTNAKDGDNSEVNLSESFYKSLISKFNGYF